MGKTSYQKKYRENMTDEQKQKQKYNFTKKRYCRTDFKMKTF